MSIARTRKEACAARLHASAPLRAKPETLRKASAINYESEKYELDYPLHMIDIPRYQWPPGEATEGNGETNGLYRCPKTPQV